MVTQNVSIVPNHVLSCIENIIVITYHTWYPKKLCKIFKDDIFCITLYCQVRLLCGGARADDPVGRGQHRPRRVDPPHPRSRGPALLLRHGLPQGEQRGYIWNIQGVSQNCLHLVFSIFLGQISFNLNMLGEF